ncbi:maleylacetoacetate isomerase [Legionella sp. W05-934-2]|jgi:maleylacetoacetate isomerase|uniref:maleylacetoacetate isomerase n=1 Tax=Legionella sp. W05-934-2 TaxID=1198649 RepID=UPI003461A045
MMQLYDYFRSSASYRARITLAFKGIDVKLNEIHLVNDGGQQHQTAYRQLNPQGLVPTLIDEEYCINQSLAIIDYLEQKYPTPSVFPDNAFDRSLAYSIALTIACDMHPLNNLRVLNYLKSHFSAQEDDVQQWYHHWLTLGFDAIEKKLETHQANELVCIGKNISIADICLVPQVYNAKRFQFPLNNYPRIETIYEACMTLPYFETTKP